MYLRNAYLESTVSAQIMIEVKFKNYAGTGSQDTHWEHAPLDQFLFNTPLFVYELLAFGVIPPLHIFNERFLLGSYDVGMGGACDWKPFQLIEEEYNELVESLLTNPDHEIIEDKELWCKPTFKKWHGAMLSKYAHNARNKH